jgi:hypothetical protein
MQTLLKHGLARLNARTLLVCPACLPPYSRQPGFGYILQQKGGLASIL